VVAAAGAGAGAMTTDLGALAASVAGFGLDIAFAADPRSAVRMRIGVCPAFDFPIYASASLAAGTVIAVSLRALCAAWNPQPALRSAGPAPSSSIPAQLRCWSTAVRVWRRACAPLGRLTRHLSALSRC